MISVKDFGRISSVFLAHSGDEVVRFRASSGGFVKSFLVYLLKSRAIDFAIITRTGGPAHPLVPETIITNSREDILSTRTNSVYAVNDPFPTLKELAHDKKYAFVGLPCQVRNLRALQKRGKYRNIVIAIGLFCNHTPNIKFTKEILQKLDVREDDVKQIEYRGNGWPGGFTAHLKNGQEKFISLEDYWSNDLNNGPEACKYCSEIAENADIYVGDPWKLGLEKTDAKGTSLVVCRTRQASALVRKAAELGHIKIEECTREQLIQSQGYHVENKIRRGSKETGTRRHRSSLDKLRRMVYLVFHPVAGYHVAMNILKALSRKSKPLIKLKAALNGYRQAIKLLRVRDHFTLTYVGCRVPIVNRVLKRIFANRVLISYWREDRRLVNFGDYITEVLAEELGYKTVSYCNASSLNILSNYGFCLMVIGSALHKATMDRLRLPALYVWGQGKGHGEFFDISSEPYATKVKIFAVRGPHTVRQLNLNAGTPMGDPALLMPLFFKVKKNPAHCEVSYIPHWSNRADWEAKREDLGADRFVDVGCSRRKFWSTFRDIVSSRFVLTNSLHTAIICHAYGTPWALCLAEGDELNFPDKWRDFFEFLGLKVDGAAIRNYAEALQWWTDVGSKARRPDLLPLLESFPLPIKNKRILSIIGRMKSNRPTVKD